MRKRVAACVMLVLAAACAPPDGYAPPAPPYCPFDRHMVIFDGDSIAIEWPKYISLPVGGASMNLARGASAFGGYYLPGVDTIGDRIDASLNACGNGIGVAAISGGVVDLSQNQPVQAAIDGIHALDADLHARGVKAIFVTIQPVAERGSFAIFHQARRKQVNDWMSTPGNMFSHVVSCQAQLESAPGSDLLAPRYWRMQVDGTPDVVHPNDAGYQVIAACIQPAITAALG